MGSSESKPKKNASYKLTYFNGRGRGEVIRLCFAAAGVKFTDVRVEFSEWPELKSKMPLGFMPLLEVDGMQLSQSIAIARFLAQRFGLHGSTDLEGAKIDEVLETVAEFALELSKTFFIQDEQAKEEAVEKITDKLIPFNMDYLEKTLKENKTGSGYLVGRKLSVADLAVFNCLETLETVVPSAVEKYPNVRDLGSKVGVNGNIARYVGNRPKQPF